MPLEHGLPTGPFASRLRGAGGGPVDNPAAYHMHTHPSPPSFRLIPQLELTPRLVFRCADVETLWRVLLHQPTVKTCFSIPGSW